MVFFEKVLLLTLSYRGKYEVYFYTGLVKEITEIVLEILFNLNQ